MKYLIYPLAIFTVCFSISLAMAQNKVVVIPMGYKKGSPAPVAKTGQTRCYDPACTVDPCAEVACVGTGQDGEYQKGVAATPRFTDNGDGTVTDHLTGLIWLREGNCTTFFAGDLTGANQRPWQAALAAANRLANGYCDLTDGSVASDWRLPNRRELLSLVDESQVNPSLPAGHPFLNTQSSYYWSSTSIALYTSGAWLVNFNYGGVGDGSNKSGSWGYVRAVRGGQ